MIGLPQILAELEPIEGGWRTQLPESWLQGRTAYGGLSTALALHCAQQSEPDLPPLRSALVAFIGPLSGEITIRATRLRRGRNATFIQSDIEGEAGLGYRATFVFMGAIESELNHQTGSAPDFPRPGPETQTYFGHSAVSFTQNFEFVDERAGSAPAEWLRWIRLRDRKGLDPMVELAAVADCLPPAALKLLGRPVPMSSMTWQLNLLGPRPSTTDGWWLLLTITDYAHAGSSAQLMGVWNADGEPVAQQSQSVALFG